MITVTKHALKLVHCKNPKLGFGLYQWIDHNNQMITLTLITLSGFYCTYCLLIQIPKPFYNEITLNKAS
jgi:hypothetical protein